MDLFKENRIALDKELVAQMFQGSLFTLQKFKAINNSPEGLQNFKDCLRPHYERICRQMKAEDEEERRQIKEHVEACHAEYSEEQVAAHLRRAEQLAAREVFLPRTFESMMELFGINLQRKVLFEKYLAKHKLAGEMTRQPNVSAEELISAQEEAHRLMLELIRAPTQKEGCIVNEHNKLFQNLFTRIRQEKQKAEERRRVQESKSELTLTQHSVHDSFDEELENAKQLETGIKDCLDNRQLISEGLLGLDERRLTDPGLAAASRDHRMANLNPLKSSQLTPVGNVLLNIDKRVRDKVNRFLHKVRANAKAKAKEEIQELRRETEQLRRHAFASNVFTESHFNSELSPMHKVAAAYPSGPGEPGDQVTPLRGVRDRPDRQGSQVVTSVINALAEERTAISP